MSLALFSVRQLCNNYRRNFTNYRFQNFPSEVNISPSGWRSAVQVANKLVSRFTRNHNKNMFSKSFRYSALAVAAAGVSRYRLQHVLCEDSDSSHTRLVGMNSIETLHQEAHFDFKKFFHIVKSEVWLILVAVVSALAVAMLNIKIPVVLGDLVDVISKFIAQKGSDADAASFFNEVRSPAMNLIYMYISQSIYTFAYISALSISGERVARNMRTALFESVIEQDIAFFDAHKTGEISSRLTNDVQEFKSCYKLCISQGLRSIAQTAGCIVSLYVISPKMTALMIGVLPVIIGVGTCIGRVLRQMSKSAQSQVARASAVADEAIGNIRTVRAFAMEDTEKELYWEEVEKVRKINSFLGIGIGVFQGLTNLALNGIVLGVLYVGGSLMHSAEMSPGNMMSFLVATQTIQKSLAHLSTLFGMFVRALAAGARIFQYINLTPSIPIVGGVVLETDQIKGEVQFKEVSFSYPTRPEQVVISDFSLLLPPGKMVALCGLSGGGKSTVAALLERFYDVSRGSITIDGTDIRDIDPSFLRREVIGYINQEPILFATTVMENIRYGRPSATNEEVVEAAKLANADEFIRGFSDGYNTLLGERGATVSGGQKQRIAIARALLKDPKILILDEATSALDVESEKAVQEALDYASKGRTVLVIAHRLSTIQNADIIAVVLHGQIAEIGNHEKLCRRKGLYWNLINQQQTEEEKRLLFERIRPPTG